LTHCASIARGWCRSGRASSREPCAAELEARHGRLIVAGVNPAVARVVDRGGLTDVLGPDGIVPATDEVFGALNIAVARGREWVGGRG